MFTNIDEHVRRMLRRPAGAELHPDRSKERPMLVPCDGRHLDPGKVGRIDVRRPEQDHATGKSGAPRSLPGVSERCQRVSSAEPPLADKAAELSPPCESTRGGRTARSRHRAVKHEAAGGWMTARWSGAVQGRGGNTAPRDVPRRRTPAGFPTACGGESPERTLLINGCS